ncbi:putative F-box domain, leucine-rich repeat domain superfamily, F-box-like domain superfamily [Helianthus annuus]|nr:putative F-box domain, leucine-rich repeat domain superfamily, F-box-like domain superfamily [Helianthus annuus]
MAMLIVMTDYHHTRRRRFVTDDDDIITNLPEDLINPILERLPVKEAVRTSVLSKRWRYRWTTMKSLDFLYGFSGQFLKIGAYCHNGFIRVISQIMIHHQGPILQFHVHIPKEIFLDSFQEVDQWMLLLARNNLRVLDFRNSNRIYQIPSSVFSCLELRVLGLRGCIFNPPLEFKGFPNLQDINLQKVNFGGNLGGTVINLPQLKNLSLHTCVNVNNFNIMAVNLQHLLVFGCPDAMLLRLLHSKRLSAVHICLGKSMQALQVERYSLARMLSKLPKLVTFNIDGYFLKVYQH